MRTVAEAIEVFSMRFETSAVIVVISLAAVVAVIANMLNDIEQQLSRKILQPAWHPCRSRSDNRRCDDW